ncbi:ferrous iron transport protein B [Anaerosporobacter faecicola]|uniref:ferrous iron transport protein B n=1 Tax=Anaerosporobacter faecicola TaxID=2718714 RepID=UPI001439F2F2|nr:ferrous iron transport protein B [Anaerosporobacter faecicola]
MKEELQVAFIGNPNCGKTTLFNAYTGAKLKVANWPGVTVEKKEGAFKYHSHLFKLVDLPGIYSLTSYTLEEKLSREYILDDTVDVIVDVADASCLERNLFLTLQLIELGKPVILALNMMDIVKERGMEIDLHRLPEMLGIPVIPVSARKKTGLDILMHAVAHHQVKHMDSNLEHHHDGNVSNHKHSHHLEYAVVYSDEIEDKIDEIIDRLYMHDPDLKNPRWYAIKILEQDPEICEQFQIDFSDVVPRSYETDIINQKYDFIEEIIDEVLVNKEEKAAKTEKIDHYLTHRVLGLPIFLGIMALVFFLTFTIGDWLKGYFEVGITGISDGVLALLQHLHANDMVISLVVDGIISGVGGILTFLPNIFILFLALAFLEDSGYMSRVAYIMDGIMGKIGLSGRAFIPMLLGFGCSVPAVMATRALEDSNDRRKTILVTPFMSCSARLPVYVLFSDMFFGNYAVIAAFSMYVIGLVIAILIAFIMTKLQKKSETHSLLIELPEYKTPNLHTIVIYVWDKIKDYLTKAGTTIFVASIIIWFILNVGPHGIVTDITESFGAGIGKFLVPILVPTGLGLWQIALALISGLAAKEVVVSSIGVLFGIGNIASTNGRSALLEVLSNADFTAVNAYSMMIFVLLYTPCVATIATIKREMKSVRWTVFAIVFQVAVAWLVSTLFFQIAQILM